jgi:hypothetical protein
MNKKDINYQLFTKKIVRYRYLCTQLRIFQKEIKSTYNQELMHTIYEEKE